MYHSFFSSKVQPTLQEKHPEWLRHSYQTDETLRVSTSLKKPPFIIDMSLEQTIDNLQIRNANMVTFVGTSNTMVDTTTGRIQTKGIQHNSNVITDVSGPHGRGVATLKKYPEIVFDEGKFDGNDSTNTYVQAGYTVSASSVHSEPYQPWKAFDDNISNNTGWLPNFTITDHNYSGSEFSYSPTGTSSLTTNTSDVINGEWLQIKLPSKIQLSSIVLHARSGNSTQIPEDFKVLGSNTGIDGSWVVLASFLDESGAVNSGTEYDINALSYYNHYAIITTQVVGDGGTNYGLSIAEWKLYGYEELATQGDHSVDTTFKSRFNNPQTTGVQVLVDGATGVGTNQISGGPDPSGNQSTYVTDGKYWTLNGTLTSNLAVEANTFLEGDQPHAVSVWFNSSNLEANVSNTCVFSVSDQEKLDSMNLDLQSNTWHNLTYAYQGEGGSRVTYLDGRKVSEDQAEDTFGDYPPFAMTGYSQGGYVASTNNFYTAANNERDPWRAYDGLTDSDSTNCWGTKTVDSFQTSGEGLAQNNTSGNPDTFIDETGTLHTGHWNKIELPHKLQVDYISIYCELNDVRVPGKVAILGSNDDEKWYLLKDVTTNLDFTTATPQVVPMENNKNKGFKYLILVVKTVPSLNGAVTIREISYYGHRENDLVRLPDPTRVLKYPHIAMTGPAQRGYVASASSFYNSGTEPEHGFDGVLTSSGLNHTWESGPRTGSGNGRYTSGSTFNTSYLNEVPPLGEGGFQTTESSNTWTGEWLQIELPHSINTTKYVFGNADGNSQWNDRIPTSGVILGSTNGSTWNFIHQFSSTLKDQTLTISHTGYYKYFRLIGTTVGGTQTIMLIPEWELYGTGVDSVPIQIGGGNIDRVANFRVYDKFIEEDQALEIWDAQKDEFGRVKSSMTLQKGRLGIGTDEPEGRLAVLDEPHNLEEFPPRAMTGYKNYFEGHGEFCASASDEYTATPRLTWKAFNKSSENIDDGWMPSGVIGVYDATSSGTATGTTPTYNGSASLGGIGGEWISLEFPYKVKINRLKITSYHVGGSFRGLNDGFLLGRGDKNSEWTRVHEITNLYTVYGVRDADQLSAEISFTNDGYYNEYALIATSTTGATVWTAMELKYFGTREQRQSVLHDGQLTLTKNLDVPRIGPPLDADDTPRRDRLVVEYNTSTNPTFEGAVRDTSGRGNDGVFVNQTHYDATERALVFDGTDDRILSRLQNPAGESLFSGSLWYKPAGSGNEEDFVWIGTHASGKAFIFKYNSPNFEFSFYGNDAIFNYTLNAGTWYHLAFAYSGGTASSGRRIWVNGVEVAYTSGASSTALNLDANAQLMIGDRTDNGGDLYGSISNFKLYDCTLTASEVKTLYDMGRMGGKANSQPLHISGPVNVMGDIRYITNIRPLALPTMWDHEANGHFTRGIYPITGTQGGSKVYNMLCEPDWCGGGWMCAAQIPRGKDVVTTTINLFEDEYGDPSNLTWSNDFAVPMNIFSNDSGYDLDVMLVLLGGTRAGRAGAGGARNGGIYRGVNLTQALNTGWPTNGVYPANISTSGLASSPDGYHFTSRTPSGYNFQPYKANAGWRLSFSAVSQYDMAYNNADINIMGWLIHTAGNNLWYTYSVVHGGGGYQDNNGNTSWAAVRFFVRPKRY